MKRIIVNVLFVLLGAIMTLVIGMFLLFVIRKDQIDIEIRDNIEAASSGNIVQLSDQRITRNISGSFHLNDKIYVEYKGIQEGEASAKSEIRLEIKLSGTVTRQMFEDNYYICSMNAFKEALKNELIRKTGDNDLQIIKITLPYISEKAAAVGYR